MRDSELLVQCRSLLEDDKLEGLFRVYGFSDTSRELDPFTFHDTSTSETPLFSRTSTVLPHVNSNLSKRSIRRLEALNASCPESEIFCREAPGSNRSSRGSNHALWLNEILEEDSNTIRRNGPPGFLEASTSDEELSERVCLSRRIDIDILSSDERKAVAPTISGYYENVFINGEVNMQTPLPSVRFKPEINFIPKKKMFSSFERPNEKVLKSNEDGEKTTFGWLNKVCVEVASMVKDFLHGGIHLEE